MQEANSPSSYFLDHFFFLVVKFKHPKASAGEPLFLWFPQVWNSLPLLPVCLPLCWGSEFTKTVFAKHFALRREVTLKRVNITHLSAPGAKAITSPSLSCLQMTRTKSIGNKEKLTSSAQVQKNKAATVPEGVLAARWNKAGSSSFSLDSCESSKKKKKKGSGPSLDFKLFPSRKYSLFPDLPWQEGRASVRWWCHST